MTQSIADILSKAEDPAYIRVATAKIAFVLPALRDEHAELDARLKELRKKRDTVDIPPDEIEVAERVQEIEKEMEGNSVEFRFRGVSNRAWRDLMAKHPPTKEQIARSKQFGEATPDVSDTFWYDALAACCAEPEMTPDDVKRLESAATIDGSSWDMLRIACRQANMSAAPPKSLAAGLILHRNDKSAAIAANGESPEASSSDA